MENSIALEDIGWMNWFPFEINIIVTCNNSLHHGDPGSFQIQIDINCKKIIESLDLFNQTLSFVVNILLNVCLLFIGVSILQNSLWHY